MFFLGSLPRSRPKSLALSTPTKLLSLEEARALVNTGGGSPKQNYIEVGGGPANLPDRYHTVIDLPSKYVYCQSNEPSHELAWEWSEWSEFFRWKL